MDGTEEVSWFQVEKVEIDNLRKSESDHLASSLLDSSEQHCAETVQTGDICSNIGHKSENDEGPKLDQIENPNISKEETPEFNNNRQDTVGQIEKADEENFQTFAEQVCDGPKEGLGDKTFQNCSIGEGPDNTVENTPAPIETGVNLLQIVDTSPQEQNAETPQFSKLDHIEQELDNDPYSSPVQESDEKEDIQEEVM